MTVPGTDPQHPPYGMGTGDAPIAVGVVAFETPVQAPIDIRVQSNPRFSRRELKANQQELGYEIESMAAFEQPPAAAAVPSTYPDPSPMSVLADDTFGVVPPDDGDRAVARVTQ